MKAFVVSQYSNEIDGVLQRRDFQTDKFSKIDAHMYYLSFFQIVISISISAMEIKEGDNLKTEVKI